MGDPVGVFMPTMERKRPLISLDGNGNFLHNDKKCKVVMSKRLISCACSDITPEALKKLLEKYDSNFPGDVVVIQTGE